MLSPSVVSAPAINAEVATRKHTDVQHRSAPVMPHRSTRNPHLIEVSSPDGSGSASSSLFTISSVQTPPSPVVNDVSNMSDENSQLLPSGGGQMLAENQLDFEASSLNNVQLSGQLAHYASETNLASSGSMPRGQQSRRVHGRQVIGAVQPTVSSEYAKQLRRRSRSADNLSHQHKQKVESAAWSVVDIDTKAHAESAVAQQSNVQQQQQKQSTNCQKPMDSLPTPFTTTRLQPCRHQMSTAVVRSHLFNVWLIFTVC